MFVGLNPVSRAGASVGGRGARDVYRYDFIDTDTLIDTPYRYRYLSILLSIPRHVILCENKDFTSYYKIQPFLLPQGNNKASTE